MAKLVPQSHNLYQTPEPGAEKNSSDKENSYQLGALPAETGELSWMHSSSVKEFCQTTFADCTILSKLDLYIFVSASANKMLPFPP